MDPVSKHGMTNVMFAKLGDYLTENNIRRPMRYRAPSGEEFVVLPRGEYALLTGIDVDTLPMVGTFGIIPDITETEKNISSPIANETTSASVLAFMQLEDEIGVDRLPL